MSNIKVKDLLDSVYGKDYYKRNEIFDIDDYIEQHKHIDYCEAILHPDGRIEDVKPSHQETLLRIYGSTWDDLPKDVIAIDYLVDKTNCIAIWYQGIIGPKTLTLKQRISLTKLYNNEIIASKERF